MNPPSTPVSLSKRHSLNLNTGPRPLHLVDGNVCDLPGPFTAPLVSNCSSSSSSPSTPETPLHRPSRHTSRRQSSISYLSRSSESTHVRSYTVGRGPALLRSNSLGLKNESISAATVTGDKRTVEGERPPLTLVEKHADLLHFIAQKESKCLELRSQLAAHEAELLQLKQKWGRIVSRGFERSNHSNDSSPAPIHVSTNSLNQGGAVLDGIKEGVQGVSRLIAAGLMELQSPSTSTSTSASPDSRSSPSALPQRYHSDRQSSSSVSTFATNTTRLSQSSSVSSVPDDLDPPLREEEDTQVLMVHDTGATPTVSPNPAFMHQQQQKREKERSNIDGLPASAPDANFAKIHRRKSRDKAELAVTPESSFAWLDEDDSVAASASPSAKSESVKQTSKVRPGQKGVAFAPASSIPGLASLSAVGSAPSWVGSMGKRWGDLQRGSTFTKNQRRASALISDVSQSIVSVLSSPQMPTTSSTASLSPKPPALSASMSSSSSSVSLLDDDDDTNAGLGTGLGSVMMPDSKLTPMSTPNADLDCAKNVRAQGRELQDDDDDEWNW